MDTYGGPDACGVTPCNLTKALGKDRAVLCTADATNCSRYMPGLMMGKPGALGNLSASELTATMDWLLDQGVTAISLWAGAPPHAHTPHHTHLFICKSDTRGTLSYSWRAALLPPSLPPSL